MKKAIPFLICYLGLLYFMLGTLFCYQLGKTHSLTAAFAGLWDATKPLLPVMIAVAAIACIDFSAKKKNKI